MMDSRPGSEMELLSVIVFLLARSQTRILQKMGRLHIMCIKI